MYSSATIREATVIPISDERDSDLYSTILWTANSLKTERNALIPISASPRRRGGHLLPHERHREAEPRGSGLPQGQHARLPEPGDDRRHSESVSAMTRETLICTVLCNRNSLLIAHADVNKDWKKFVYSDSSIPDPAAATFFPISAIVKPILEDRAYRKAGMPDYQNVETTAVIPWEWVL